MKRRTVAILLAILVAGGLLGSFAAGWWSGGHETVAEAAAARLPDDVPAFFRGGGKHLAHFAVDPDRWKNRELNFLRRQKLRLDHACYGCRARLFRYGTRSRRRAKALRRRPVSSRRTSCSWDRSRPLCSLNSAGASTSLGFPRRNIASSWPRAP